MEKCKKKGYRNKTKKKRKQTLKYEKIKSYNTIKRLLITNGIKNIEKKLFLLRVYLGYY